MFVRYTVIVKQWRRWRPANVFAGGLFASVGLVSVGLVSATLVTASLSNLPPLRGPSPSAPDRLPISQTIVWAWERAESLEFLPSPKIAVAVLVGRLRLAAGTVTPFPRLQPLALPQDTPRIAVVRLESDPRQRPDLGSVQQQQVTAAILAWSTSPPGFDVLQIDFDATVSERDFYRRLLRDLRAQLPEAMPISITALASWCLGDAWLDGLPIDEAVPMLFRMGPDARLIRATLARGTDFSHPLCRSSYGLSSDEPLPVLRSNRRLYLFHPQAWSEPAWTGFHHRLTPDI